MLMRGCSAAALVVVAAPALAQTADPEVVMRRPLPNARSLTQTNCDPAQPDCVSTPTPTPDPSDPTGSTPTPTPPPGFTYDPQLPTSDPGNSGGIGVAQWTYGAWSGGGQCGQESTYTRDIGCEVVGPAYTPIGMNMQDGSVQNASYAPGMSPADLSPAIYDPSSTDVKMHLAQFGGGGGGSVKRTPASISRCMQDLGPPPANTYHGTQGSCDFTAVQTSTDGGGGGGGTGGGGTGGGGTGGGGTGWILPPGADGTVSCSAEAYRIPSYSCVGPDGNPADMTFCTENVRSGGTRNSYTVDVQYGNFAGCKAGWVGEAQDNICFSTDGQYTRTDKHTAYFEYKCVREDGTVLTGPDESACAADDRPFDGYKVVGSCEKQFYFSGAQDACVGGYDGSNIIAVKEIGQNELYNAGPQSDWCKSVGAKSCSMRMVDNSNYSKAPYGTYQVVACSSDYSRVGAFYFDEGAYRSRDNEEGPFFYNFGGVIDYTPDRYGADNDDPHGILNGRPIKHDNGGGGIG